MLVVHDSIGKIAFTVDAPYPEGLVDLYEDLATGDPEFNVIDTEQAEIVSKYVDVEGANTLEDRPVMELTYDEVVTAGADLNIAGLPDNCTILVDGFVGGSTTTEDTIGLETVDPGFYTIQIESWPYLPFSFTVDVI